MRPEHWKQLTPSGPLVKPTQAAKYLSLGLSTYYALAKQGRVPAPIKITPDGRAAGVPQNLLDAFVQGRIEESNG